MSVRKFWGAEQGLLETERTVASCTATCQQPNAWYLEFASAPTQTQSSVALET